MARLDARAEAVEELKVYTKEGIKTETVYEINEVSYLSALLNFSDVKKRQVTYLNCPAAFDIETTNITAEQAEAMGYGDRAFSFMYHWQFCLNNEVVFGRTWEEFQQLLKKIQRAMHLDDLYRLVIYCHNLSYEFQFMRRFINVTGGFFKDKYKPLTIVTSYGIEFRDSLALTNMSLDKFLKNENCIYKKNDGDKYDYNKLRTPKTPLTEYERSYCYCDVRGLCEAIGSLMKQDNLAKIPLTSTGYVRRAARQSMKQNKKNRLIFTETKLDLYLYRLMREAFRGGDTHANIRYSNQILHDVTSRDIQSSYPTSMMCDLFPITPFERITLDDFETLNLEGYAYIIKIRLTEVKYIGDCGNPYISRSKCTQCVTNGLVIDNGRVMFSHGIEITLTDIDWQIIQAEYTFDDVYFHDIYVSRYGELPKEYKDIVMEYYRGKTELKGIDQYMYMKSKNRLNSLYGMMVTNILQDLTEYVDNEYVEEKELSPLKQNEHDRELLEKYYKSRNNFLCYQWGIWVTAHARMRLRKALWAVGKDVVYCDTDSVKYINNHDDIFERFNDDAVVLAKKYGAFAIDPKGKTQYMGIWDDDGKYKRFKTLGAKKYCIEEEGKVLTTIAGVSKDKGREFFSKTGIEGFEIGAKISDSGHLVAYYNDDEIHEITINGCTFKSGSNIALLEGGYEVGVTNEYMELLKMIVDNGEIIY